MEEKDFLTHLGARSNSPSTYDSSLLERVPRSLNREQYGISGKEFVGIDSWHNYEVSFLTTSGLPISGIVKMNVPARSEFIVESKSLKLYFNSFNMEHLCETVEQSIQQMVEMAERDLSLLLECEVKLAFFTNDCIAEDNELLDYQSIDSIVGAEFTIFNSYNENPALLKAKRGNGSPQKLMSHLLRSNCKVTHQPDWGSIFIYLDGDKHIDELSLLKYIVSFRNEFHFHEEICEMAYYRIMELYRPKELMVACLYTRRGGIDICPIRCTSSTLIPKAFSVVTEIAKRTARM
ncbi:MAG: NADPH-dependent 7-cyano-7-deazaguanine reductase QueF [Mangrovibacterium sp.]